MMSKLSNSSVGWRSAPPEHKHMKMGDVTGPWPGEKSMENFSFIFHKFPNLLSTTTIWWYLWNTEHGGLVRTLLRFYAKTNNMPQCKIQFISFTPDIALLYWYIEINHYMPPSTVIEFGTGPLKTHTLNHPFITMQWLLQSWDTHYNCIICNSN